VPAPSPAWESPILRLRALDAGSWHLEIFAADRSAWLPAASVSRDFSSGYLFSDARNAAGEPMPLHHPHDRILILGRLAALGGGMLHSSTVADQGRALLFTGPSGAGKTTIARLWKAAGATLLNDERSLVRPADGRFVAGSSPWHGEHSEVHPGAYPLEAVLFLRQAPASALIPLRPAEALARLLTLSFAPVFLPDGLDRTLDAWSKLLDCTPAYVMDFTPDQRPVDLCRRLLLP